LGEAVVAQCPRFVGEKRGWRYGHAWGETSRTRAAKGGAVRGDLGAGIDDRGPGGR